MANLYVVQSGNGFVINDESLQMVGTGSKSRLQIECVAMMAKRMKRKQAERCVLKLRQSGFDSTIVPISQSHIPEAGAK